MHKNTLYRLASLSILIVLLIGTSLAVQASSQLAPAAATALTVNPAADAYVVQTSASTNYGTGISLHVDNSPITHSYLRFVVSGLNGASVQSALLRIYANSANTTGFSVQTVSNDTWVENQINYSNAPAAGSTLGTPKAFSAGTWVEVNVSSYVKSAGIFSFELTSTSSTKTNLASREDALHAPQLVLTTSGSTAGPTPTPAPTGGGSGKHPAHRRRHLQAQLWFR